MKVTVETGRVLRQARRTRGLTLKDVGVLSGGVFSPTAVAGYERGERNISISRFCDLAFFYGFRPEVLLAQALAGSDTESTRLVDLTEEGNGAAGDRDDPLTTR